MVAITGLMRKKPMQRDLFTGNLVRPPKAGRGDHVLLKREDAEPVAIPGMAHFAATGPEGKFCRDCTHCRDLPLWGKNRSTPALAGRKDTDPPKRIERDACAKAAELYDGTVQRGGLRFNLACKYFEPR